MSTLPTITGSVMRQVRQSQRRSAESIAEGMALSRNTLLNYEKSDSIVPIEIVRSFVESLEISNDEFWDLLENLQAIKQQETDKNSEFSIDPKKMESYIFDNFKRNLGSKESTINNLQNQNDKLKEKIQEEQLGKILMKTEIDRLSAKFDTLRADFESNKRWVENAISQKAEKIEKDLEKIVQDTLAQYSKEVSGAIKESESSGLGDFLQQSGLSGLISNPAFAATIAQLIGNAINPSQNQVPNPIDFGQNMSGFQGMSGIPDTENNQMQDLSSENNIGQ